MCRLWTIRVSSLAECGKLVMAVLNLSWLGRHENFVATVHTISVRSGERTREVHSLDYGKASRKLRQAACFPWTTARGDANTEDENVREVPSDDQDFGTDNAFDEQRAHADAEAGVSE